MRMGSGGSGAGVRQRQGNVKARQYAKARQGKGKGEDGDEDEQEQEKREERRAGVRGKEGGRKARARMRMGRRKEQRAKRGWVVFTLPNPLDGFNSRRRPRSKSRAEGMGVWFTLPVQACQTLSFLLTGVRMSKSKRREKREDKRGSSKRASFSAF
jgi:hypothetical protein